MEGAPGGGSRGGESRCAFPDALPSCSASTGAQSTQQLLLGPDGGGVPATVHVLVHLLGHLLGVTKVGGGDGDSVEEEHSQASAAAAGVEA